MALSHRVDPLIAYPDDEDFRSLVFRPPLITLQILLHRSRFTSASNWDQSYYEALKLYVMTDLPPSHVLPDRYFPSDAELNQHQKLFEFSMTDLQSEHFTLSSITHPCRAFYAKLLNIIQAGSEELVSAGSPLGGYSAEFTGPGSPAARDKATKRERVSEELLKLFVSYWAEEEGSFAFNERNLTINVRAESFKFGARICRQKVVIGTDGYLGISDRGDEATRIRSAVGCFFEARRRLHRKSPEDILAQITAELISVAQYNQSKQRHPIPESFGMFIHHRKCLIVSGMFSLEYLHRVENSAGPDAGDYILLKATREYDLADCADRREFGRCIVGLIRYLQSGESFVGTLKL
ncbi:hypothetical protein HDU85_005622 [Gaertneriomyces sp. JEL0708]|nr:hypothetical protein HDU85_005622 [Gaertneriomyces sp. JEL0708]